MPQLRIIIASTRPGRVGLPVGRWFESHAREHGAFEVVVTDLAELGLPMMDEPKHPRLGNYENEHTLRWSEAVGASDAFVLVLPEYNHGLTAPIKNALDYLHGEWAYKPVGFVSYGGISAGTRAVQMAKPVTLALRMVPVVEGVNIPFVAESIGEDGCFEPGEATPGAADAMLDELARVEGATRELRRGAD